MWLLPSAPLHKDTKHVCRFCRKSNPLEPKCTGLIFAQNNISLYSVTFFDGSQISKYCFIQIHLHDRKYFIIVKKRWIVVSYNWLITGWLFELVNSFIQIMDDCFGRVEVLATSRREGILNIHISSRPSQVKLIANTWSSLHSTKRKHRTSIFIMKTLVRH